MKRLLTVMSVFFIAISLSFNTVAENYVTNETASVNIAETNTDVQNMEEKTYCEATLDDDFADDTISVVITRAYTIQGITFAVENFPNIQIASVRSLTDPIDRYFSGDFHTLSADEQSSILKLANLNEFHQILEIKLQYPGKENVLQTIKELEKLDFIKSASPNYFIPIDPIDDLQTLSSLETDVAQYSINAVSSNMQNLKSQNSFSKIKASQAWAVAPNTNRVLVGVIDSGISPHPDFGDALDPDISGVAGRDFVNNNADTTDDPTGHGTHVAGIIYGLNDQVSLIPLQVVSAPNNEGKRTYSQAAITEAVTYACRKNIPILNCSFGAYASTQDYEEIMRTYSGLIVCSAGNGQKETDDSDSIGVNTNSIQYLPSGFDFGNIMSVTATTNNDALPQFANYGNKTVDLAAPGTDIYSIISDKAYGKKSGTSMAAPHVTGVAALLLSANTSLTTRQLKNAIMYGVDEISSLGAKCVTGGRLNAYESMRIVDNDMFIIDYHANGGSGKMIPTKVPYGVTTTTTSNAFFRDGYDFDCWYIQRDSDDKWRYRNPDDTSQTGWYTAGSQPSGWVKFPYSNGTTVSQTIDEVGGVVHFYAQWKKYYTVQYNANGGSGTMASTKVYYGNTTTTRTNTFTRSGYDFDCWYIKRSSDGKWRYQNADNTDSGWYTEGSQPSGWSKYRYDNGISVSKTINEAGGVVHFYAQWKQYFTVKYNANGGSGSMTNTKVYYGVQTNLRANTFTRSGYDFLYWYAHRESDNKWRYWNPNNTSETGWYTAGSQPSGWVKHPYYNAGWVIRVSSVPGDVVNLHAQWRKYFTVQYNANGGSGTMSPTKVPYGVTTTTTSNKFTRSGYDFDCWYVRRSSDGKWRYRDPDDSSQSGWYTEGSQPSGWVKFRYSNGTTVSQTVSNPGETVTFYAQWKKYFIVQYRPNGGTGTMEDTKVYYGVSTATRKNTFLYQGRWFKHWAIQRSSDDKWRYRNPDDTSQSGWYTRGSQPDGWEFFPYSDGTTVSKTVSNPGEIVTFYARWS